MIRAEAEMNFPNILPQVKKQEKYADWILRERAEIDVMDPTNSEVNHEELNNRVQKMEHHRRQLGLLVEELRDELLHMIKWRRQMEAQRLSLEEPCDTDTSAEEEQQEKYGDCHFYVVQKKNE